MTNVTEFQRESRRIDQLIWDAMALVKDERVLFCGSPNDGAWVRRAVAVGVAVTVIESDAERLAELTALGIPTLRGSAMMIPARDSSFDAVVAFHYLHEIDPTFHALTVYELARVGNRIVVVEPAPPSDRLGKRIAELYSRAKYEAGSFEEYQPIDYWRKLLAIVKADVVVQQFVFTRIAPRFLIEETVDLILDAMAIEDMPQAYLDELRELARSDDSQLSPLSRSVLVALPGGDEGRTTAGTFFRPEDEAVLAQRAATAATAPTAPGIALPASAILEQSEFPPVLGPGGELIAPGHPPSAAPAPVAPPFAPPPAAEQPPAPPVVPAPALPPAHAQADAAPDEMPFGLPAEEPSAEFPAPPPPTASAPLGTPFALPDDPDPFGLEADPGRRPGTGWSWEPPEPEEDEPEPKP